MLFSVQSSLNGESDRDGLDGEKEDPLPRQQKGKHCLSSKEGRILQKHLKTDSPNSHKYKKGRRERHSDLLNSVTIANFNKNKVLDYLESVF